MRQNYLAFLMLALILVAAAALRLTGIAWDEYHHFHPDERYITWVATTIEWPDSWATALDPHKSTLNPYYWSPDANSPGIEVLRDEPRKFAYGHLPLYMGVAATRLAEWVGPRLAHVLPESWLLTQDILNAADLIEFRQLTAVSRALTALIDVGTVGLIFLLGRRLYNNAIGLLAATFLALNVMHIQLAHFFTTDPYMTFFIVAALLGMVHVGKPGKENVAPGAGKWQGSAYLGVAAVCVGLAIGSKFSAVLLFLPLTMTVWGGWSTGRQRLFWLGTAVFAVVLTFILTNPFAIIDNSCSVITPAQSIGPIDMPALNWKSCFLENVTSQGGMVRGERDLGFTRQYAGTPPFLYFLEMQLKWGMGPLLGIVAFIGLGWFLWQSLFRPSAQHSPLITHHSSYIILAWVLPFLLTTGSFYVKFMRYLQPVTPFLMLFAAVFIWQWQQHWRRGVLAGVVLLGSGLYALSFVNMYGQSHPWVTASAWMYNNVPQGALVLSEQWDDSLPTSMQLDGRYRRRSEFRQEQLTWLTYPDAADTVDRLQRNLDLLAIGDYAVIATNRIYGVVPRQPARFPLSSQYHQLLFEGTLGYELVAVYGRFPWLGGITLQPDTFGWPGLQPPHDVVDYLDTFKAINGGRADESFLVYDQPLTMIFHNTGQKTAVQMAEYFDRDPVVAP